ncbi:MAG: glucose-1-phosphate adenylyltransferase subunit GlgD [Bacilli bacterium]|nr:glucose-1-phosphate adenylyltransferase subunit GlgD [Bacilli bacterium]
MKKVIGILNLHGEPSLGELTEKRPLGTLTFLGRYGLMDFLLSNYSNSGINIIPILVEGQNDAVRSHIRDGNIWINNTKFGFLRLLMNEKMLNNPSFNTDVNNMLANSHILNDIESEYVIVGNAHFLFSFDFRNLVDFMDESGADITILYSRRNDADKEFYHCDAYSLSGNKILDSKPNNGNKKDADIGLETYIIKRSVLQELLLKSDEISRLYTLRDLINHVIHRQTYDIRGYRFDGYLVPILTIEGYIENSFALLKDENYHRLFDENWPIYTTSHNTPPAKYLEFADVKNSFIANGSIINGKVENSILSRDVIVEKDAEVKNCIIFTHSVIGERVKMRYVVADKHSESRKYKQLKGSKDDIIIIPQGAKV